MGFVFEAGFNMWFLMEQRLDDLGRWFIMWYLMDPTKGSNIYACVYVDTWLTAWRRQQIFRPCYITMHTLIFSSLRGEKLKLWKASMQVAVARFDQSVTVFGHVAWEPTWASHTAASSGFICLGNVQNWAYSLHAAHHDVYREILVREEWVTMMARQIWRHLSLFLSKYFVVKARICQTMYYNCLSARS